MTGPDSALKDKDYNLVCVVEASLRNAWTMETYIADAEKDGDAELAEWFRKIQHNSQKAGEQGKRMLRERLEVDSESSMS